MQEELISWIRSWAVFVVSGTFLTWACPSWGQAALRGLLELTPMFRFRGSWFLNIMREKGILILFITIGKKWSLEQAWFCGQLKRKDRSRFPKWITLMTALRVLIIIISHRIDWWDAPLQQHQRGSALPYQHDESTRQAWTIWKLTMFPSEVKKYVFAVKSKGSRLVFSRLNEINRLYSRHHLSWKGNWTIKYILYCLTSSLCLATLLAWLSPDVQKISQLLKIWNVQIS